MNTPVQLNPKWGKPDRTHDPYALANFQPRATDVLITTAPKAGTTWMQQILHQLRSGGDPDFDSIYEVVPWIEFPVEGVAWQKRLAAFEQIADPRLFKTHCTYEQTPGVDMVRIVLTSRDPRDCCVSMYHHRMNMTDAACARIGITQPESFDAFFAQWMAYGAWFRNVAGWWPHRNNSNVLWLRYEDMKHDLGAAIDRLLGFLGWSLTDDRRERVLEYCSFGWMKRHADKFTGRFADELPIFKPQSFIRKGQVGDHKTLLQPHHERAIFERARGELPADCLVFLGIQRWT